MLARSRLSSPFPPITSLQPQHYHEITHSFASLQPAIPSILNNFRTLSVTTGVVPLFTPSRPCVHHAFSTQVAIPLCFINLLPLCSFPKSQGLWNQANAASFAKHPGGGGFAMVSSVLGTRSGSASILLARSWPAVPFSRASAKVSQGGVCAGPYEKTGVPLPGLEPGRPRQESARRNCGLRLCGCARGARVFDIRDRAGRLLGPALVSEFRRGDRNEIDATGPAARAARNRNANGQQETNRQRSARDRHGRLALRQRSHRHAGAANPAPPHASPPLRTGAASRNRSGRAASSFAPEYRGPASSHARQKRRACCSRASARPVSSRRSVGAGLEPGRSPERKKSAPTHDVRWSSSRCNVMVLGCNASSSISANEPSVISRQRYTPASVSCTSRPLARRRNSRASSTEAVSRSVGRASASTA